MFALIHSIFLTPCAPRIFNLCECSLFTYFLGLGQRGSENRVQNLTASALFFLRIHSEFKFRKKAVQSKILAKINEFEFSFLEWISLILNRMRIFLIVSGIRSLLYHIIIILNYLFISNLTVQSTKNKIKDLNWKVLWCS